MMGTPAWRAAARSTTTRELVALLQVDLPGGLSIYAATDLVRIGGQTWEPILLPTASVTSPGAFLSPDIQPATAVFELADTRASFVADGQTVASVLKDHEVVGAAVRFWITDRSLTNMSDALPRFKGVVQFPAGRLGALALNCMQSRDHNRAIVPRTVTRQEFPQASEDTLGAALTAWFGKLGGLPNRRPFLTPYGPLQRVRELIAGGSRVGKALLVDTGRGGGATNPKAKVMVAGHQVAQIGSVSPTYLGTGAFIEGSDGTLHVMDPAGAEIFNTAAGAGFTIPDDTGTAWFPVFPTSIESPLNAADNPRAVLDRWNETRFAHLDYTGLKRTLYARLSSPANPGVFRSAQAYVIYQTNGAAAGVQFAVRNTVASGQPAQIGSMPATATPDFTSIDLGTLGWGSGVLPATPWNFSDIRLEVTFTGAGAGTVDVFAMGIAVEYLPAQELIGVDKVLVNVNPFRGSSGQTLTVPPGVSPLITQPVLKPTTANITELRGKFYSNLFGYADDAAGTFAGDTITFSPCIVSTTNANVALLSTDLRGRANISLLQPGDLVVSGPVPAGTKIVSTVPGSGQFNMDHNATTNTNSAVLVVRRVGRVIERGPDLAMLLLSLYGGVSLAAVQNTPGALGSFVDARALLQTWNGLDMVLAFGIADTTDVNTALGWIAAACASQIYLSEFDGTWRFIPWTAAPALTYTIPVKKDDLLDPKSGVAWSRTPDSSVVSGIVVSYALDEHGGTFTQETALTGDRSSSGHLFRNLRDEYMTVVAGVNDRLDFTAGATLYTANLTPGDYAPAALAQMVAAAMNLAAPGVNCIVHHVGDVVQDYNDRLDFTETIAFIGVTVTSGGFNITRASGSWITDGVQVGMYATGTFIGTFPTAPNKITAVSALTLTVQNASSGTGSVNCKIHAVRSAQVAAGHYPTMDSLLTAVQTAMNTVGTGWTANHDRTTLRVSIARVETIAQDYILQSSLGVNPSKSIAGMLGFSLLANTVTAATGEHDTEEDRFVIATTMAALALLPWATGPNGLRNGIRTCAELLGFDWNTDQLPINTSTSTSMVGWSPKNNREQLLKASNLVFGKKRDSTVDGRAIYDTPTARELRTRLVVLCGVVRLVVTFATEVHADMERGDVFTFAADIDDVTHYPVPGSDGTWAGKRFRVLSLHQQAGLSWHTEVVAIDVTT